MQPQKTLHIQRGQAYIGAMKSALQSVSLGVFSAITLYALLAGCANHPGLTGSGQMRSEWAGFEGEQKAWPTSTAAFCRRVDGVEVYGRGELPQRPYQLLGRIKLGTNPVSDHETGDQALVRICREYRADGVVLVDQKSARTEYGTLVTVWWYDAFRYASPAQ